MFNSPTFSNYFSLTCWYNFFQFFITINVLIKVFFWMRKLIVSDFFYHDHNFSKISIWSCYFDCVTKNLIIMIQKHVIFFVLYVFWFVHIHVMTIIFLCLMWYTLQIKKSIDKQLIKIIIDIHFNVTFDKMDKIFRKNRFFFDGFFSII